MFSAGISSYVSNKILVSSTKISACLPLCSAGLPTLGMDDLGQPVAHLALADGVPVYDRDGDHVGVVDHVMADAVTGIFEGLVIHTRPVVGGRHLFASHEQIA